MTRLLKAFIICLLFAFEVLLASEQTTSASRNTPCLQVDIKKIADEVKKQSSTKKSTTSSNSTTVSGQNHESEATSTNDPQVRVIKSECHKIVYGWENGYSIIHNEGNTTTQSWSEGRTYQDPDLQCFINTLNIGRTWGTRFSKIIDSAKEKMGPRFWDADLGAVRWADCRFGPAFSSITMIHELNHMLSNDTCLYNWENKSKDCLENRLVVSEDLLDKDFRSHFETKILDEFLNAAKSYLNMKDYKFNTALDELSSYTISFRIYPKVFEANKKMTMTRHTNNLVFFLVLIKKATKELNIPKNDQLKVAHRLRSGEAAYRAYKAYVNSRSDLKELSQYLNTYYEPFWQYYLKM